MLPKDDQRLTLSPNYEFGLFEHLTSDLFPSGVIRTPARVMGSLTHKKKARDVKTAFYYYVEYL